MTQRILPLGVAGMVLMAVVLAAAPTANTPTVSAKPRIFPDYAGVTIPPNMAPLNFIIQETGARYKTRIHGKQGQSLEINSRLPSVVIPPQFWHALLKTNAGREIYFDVAVRNDRSSWTQFETITNNVAREPIDGHLVYRVLRPLYNTYVNVGIYQRDLATSDEKVVLHGSSFQHGCVNCHTFLNHRPDTMALQIRSPVGGNSMLLARSNTVVKVERTMGYISWHPSGRLLAYSANKLSLFYHTIGETRDVFDAESNLGIYRVDQNRIVIPPAIAKADRQETWPSWSPDGKHLYFCGAPRMPIEQHRTVRYDLMRIPYDIDKDEWGELETVVSAVETGLSTALPRISPDGRYLLFCMFRYGNFPIYQPSSDLYLLDLKTRQRQRLDINSPEADTWHCWSSNGRWIVFSSKRLDGVFARPYFSYFDEQGRFSKPLLMPQKDPAFYDSFIKTYNAPELIQTPISISEQDFAEAILSPRIVLKPETDSRAPSQGPSVSEKEITSDPYYSPRPNESKR